VNAEAMFCKTDPKPLRVFLQGGSHDLDNQHGNWPLANQQMDSALRFMKYDRMIHLFTCLARTSVSEILKRTLTIECRFAPGRYLM